MCYHKTDLLRNLADALFMVIPNRHQRPLQLLLCQVVECIGLIFCGSHGILDCIASVRKLLNPRIVSGCNVIGTDRKAAL